LHATNPKDRYEILGPLGCGATSRVDKARDTVLGRTVALKTLVHSFGAPAEQKQFLREAQIVSQLSHPAIVNLYDVGIEQENVAYLVMEYVSGKTLQQVLSDGVIPLPRACAWVIDLAGALGSAHRAGVIHGDVKPANILVNQDGNIKLGDFGIARLATQVSGSGSLMGTPAYLSPEQISGDPQSSRSDLFSLGVVLYQMVTGALPFQGSSITAVCAQILSVDPVPPSQRNSALPAEIDRVIMRCLAKSPADRYPSAEALGASLYPFGRDSLSSAPQPEPQPVRKVSWLAQPTRPRDLLAAAAVLLLLGCGVSFGRVAATRFRLSPAPVVATVAPKPPSDLVGYSHTDPLPVDQLEAAPEPPLPPKELPAPRLAASITRSQPSRARVPAARNASVGGPVSAPELSSPPVASPARAVERAALQIEIDSTVDDGALAIFADQTLVFTTELHARASTQPLRLEQALPAGPHQLRVALYRPDKSLQTAKEGLGEIRADTLNSLKIHVARRSKLLVRRETSLDVSWPSAMAPTPRGPASASLSASAK
jgi:serine/threonine protein kinase